MANSPLLPFNVYTLSDGSSQISIDLGSGPVSFGSGPDFSYNGQSLVFPDAKLATNVFDLAVIISGARVSIASFSINRGTLTLNLQNTPPPSTVVFVEGNLQF